MRDVMLFSHANGFPVGTYRKMLGVLGDEFDIRAVERFGHDPRFPVTRSWPGLVRELLAEIDAQAEPVWLVGHSLGGFLSLMAALRRPERVRGVVMLDSPIIAGWRAKLLRVAQWLDIDESQSPAAATKNRRHLWPDLDSVWSHFKAKRKFDRWDEDVLRDYVEHGTEPTGRDHERTLRFSREIEYQIYRTLPTNMGRKVAGGTAFPVSFVAGTRSREIRQVGLGATRRIVGGRLRWIEGSHLYPMEKPLETARLIRELINEMRANAGAMRHAA